MDPLDVRLLLLGFRRLQWGVTSGEALRPSTLARLAGVSIPTVKERLARLKAMGILEHYEVFPNLGLFGLRWSAFLWELAEERKARAFRDLQGVEGVAGLLDFLGPTLQVVLHHRDEPELARRIDTISKLVGERPRVRLHRPPPPPVARPLSPLDWRIVQALRGDARRALSDVAKELGVTAKTVKTRFNRMLADRAFLLFPVLDRGRMPLFCHLVVHLEDARRAEGTAAVLAALDDRYLYAWTSPERDVSPFDLGVLADSPAAAEDLRSTVEGLPGVARARVLVVAGGYDNSEALDEEIARRLRAAQGSSASESDAS